MSAIPRTSAPPGRRAGQSMPAPQSGIAGESGERPGGGGRRVLQMQHDGRLSEITSSPAVQNISLYRNSDLRYEVPSPCRHEGRFAVVTKRGAGCDGRLRRQACFGGPDETFAAYGEIVWSWRRDRGVYPRRPVLAGQR